MTGPVCAHGERPLGGCPDCDPHLDGRMLMAAGVLTIIIILAVTFAIAWQVAS
jgi:hypothetical protein